MNIKLKEKYLSFDKYRDQLHDQFKKCKQYKYDLFEYHKNFIVLTTKYYVFKLMLFFV